MNGTVTAIWVAPEGSAPMESRESVTALAGRGLAGDRYCEGTGYYSGFDECEVTLVAQSAIEAAADEFGVDLGDGQHRRNLVTSGVDLRELLEARFRIGDAELVGTRPRPPCAHVAAVTDQDGVRGALGEHRGGICAHVADGGEVAVGDDVELLESLAPGPDHLAEAIRERQN